MKYVWTNGAGDYEFKNPLNWAPEGVPQTAEEIDVPVVPAMLYGLRGDIEDKEAARLNQERESL